MNSPMPNASLHQLQEYVAAIEQERGFVEESPLQKCLLLGEEVGELFKAVRGRTGIGIDSRKPAVEVAEELADVLIFVLAIANRFGVDLDQAFRDKQVMNRARTWTRET